MVGWIGEIMGASGKGLLEGIGTLAKDIRASITGKSILDPNQQAEIEMKLAVMENALTQAALTYDTAQMAGQIDINKIEASSSNWMASNWRPLVGMVCVAGMAIIFILKPLLPWMVQVGGIIIGKPNVTIPVIPDIPIDQLMVLLTGMLGLGSLRSFDKLKGTSK